MSEKTEKPTPKKIKDARKEGQVIKSQEVLTGIQMAVILGYFFYNGREMLQAIIHMIDVMISSVNLPLEQASGLVINEFVDLFIRYVGGLGLLLAATTVISTLVQIGPLMASKAVMPSFKKLNVLQNAKQLVSFKSLFEFAKNLTKVIVLSCVFYYLLHQYVNSFQYLPLCGETCGLMVTFQMGTWLWMSFIACYLVFALADYGFQRFTVMKQLRMSKEDTKQEHKNAEGNAEMKHKRKEVGREINSGAAGNVKAATAVVRNPTHFAVCIYYKEGETPLPKVTEKAKDHMALHIIKMAEKAGVPIVENVPLARALYKEVKPGDVIPESLFEPVADLLRFVMDVEYDEELN
ncbi:EscU/YscU/HrcU family type III secretion system export apparatus switch protein [uncultured Shewanella sp.]|uniref:EscU/YscU/HrcU family type III secretion system export apparatus switch protein n=1 Tax=uncultured Shewanella sp. TaxID=173975 RepID=UPI00261CFC3B|nr:EscU/YscU/HrcU family type III secretion system export apparatus switch protein [uncultured Shewanella sp.]